MAVWIASIKLEQMFFRLSQIGVPDGLSFTEPGELAGSEERACESKKVDLLGGDNPCLFRDDRFGHDGSDSLARDDDSAGASWLPGLFCEPSGSGEVDGSVRPAGSGMAQA